MAGFCCWFCGGGEKAEVLAGERVAKRLLKSAWLVPGWGEGWAKVVEELGAAVGAAVLKEE